MTKIELYKKAKRLKYEFFELLDLDLFAAPNAGLRTERFHRMPVNEVPVNRCKVTVDFPGCWQHCMSIV